MVKGDDSLVLLLVVSSSVFKFIMAVAQKVAKVYENVDVFSVLHEF